MRRFLLALAILLTAFTAAPAADFWSYRQGNTEYLYQANRGYVGFGSTFGNTTYYYTNQSYQPNCHSPYGSGFSQPSYGANRFDSYSPLGSSFRRW